MLRISPDAHWRGTKNFPEWLFRPAGHKILYFFEMVIYGGCKALF